MSSISKILLGLAIFTMMSFQQDRMNDKVVGTWMPSDKRSHIKIFKGTVGASKGKFYGKLIWLLEPHENGKPKLDKNNPVTTKRKNPLIGLLLLKNFTWDADDKEFQGGTIYDPKNGKTYSCYMKYEGLDKLNVRGYVGISLIGRTDTWTRVNE